MSKLRILLPLVMLTVAIAGCGGGNNAIDAGLGKEFSLHTGQTATISGEQLSIKFVEVTGDSRCPQGVQCIWAGEVSCAIEITLERANPATTQLTIVQSGANDSTKQTFDKYILTFSVDPYPVAGTKISQSDYTLNMTVTK